MYVLAHDISVCTDRDRGTPLTYELADFPSVGRFGLIQFFLIIYFNQVEKFKLLINRFPYPNNKAP